MTIPLSLCLCTFRRPDALRQLLPALRQQSLPDTPWEWIVVDNDPAHSALPVLEAWQRQYAEPALRVLHVATPNIALARNAAVQAARGDWIVMIDDDELPDPNWLRALIATRDTTLADVIVGPVHPIYPPETPDWLRRAGYFDAPERSEGVAIDFRQAYSGNVLIRRRSLLPLPGPFAPEFGVTGGSDTMLFHDLQAGGANMVWSANAGVHEHMPAQRLQLRWILRRTFRGGQSYVRAEVARQIGFARRRRQAQLGLRALIQLPLALGLAGACSVFSRAQGARWLWTASAQLGKLAALAGVHYHEYRA